MTFIKSSTKRLAVAKKSFQKKLDELAPFIRPAVIEEYESRGRRIGNTTPEPTLGTPDHLIKAE